MLRRLLEYEVPEIYNGQVEIKNIAREAGHRSKVAVSALQPGVDPVGACVGLRGMRIQNIVKELNEEKIDVIEWNTDASVFIAKALSPARVSGVYLEEDIDQGHTATVIVPDDQLSLAIGREGQNARLAAKLTGWRIDIKSTSEAAFTALANIDKPPLNKLAEEQAELVAEVMRILEKKKAERAVMPEEYQQLSRFVQHVEQRQLEQRDAQRSKRIKAMEKVRPNIPARAFEMELKELELADDINSALKNIENVGELMVRLQADEANLKLALDLADAGDDAMDAIKEAIDSLVIADGSPTLGEVQAAQAAQEKAEKAEKSTDKAAKGKAAPEAVEPVIEEAAAPVVEAEAAKVAAPAEAVAAVVDVEEDEEAPPAFIDAEAIAPILPKPDVSKKAQIRHAPPAAEPAPIIAPDEDPDALDEAGKKGGKKGKNRRRELVFDEQRGEVVSKRKRKGSRNRGWDMEE
jgi:transcription termination/antitermination protein NusA